MRLEDISEKHIARMLGRVCPYCGKLPRLTTMKEVTGKGTTQVWCCFTCDAWVGCYPKSTTPMGRLANKEHRKAKQKAHQYFDLLWKKKLMSRDNAYVWLANALNIPKQFAHIGMFKEETCYKVIDLVKRYFASRGVYLQE